jgi:2-iminobutanoate/2-iminopropanoate deaminase
METKIIEGAPKAIGPYSHAVKVGNLVYVSGQAALDPQTMKLVGETIKEQTERTFKNIEIILSGLGLEFNNVVKANVYLKNMEDFAEMNEVYAKVFGDHRPARTTIAVKQNPLDALVEIECIAELSI